MTPYCLQVCFAVDPKGILKCARTYFLQNGFVPISLTDIGETSSLRHSKDLRYKKGISYYFNDLALFWPPTDIFRQPTLYSLPSPLQMSTDSKVVSKREEEP